MERNEVLRKQASMLIDTIFSCFMSAFASNSGGDQMGISPKLRIHEQAVLLAAILNIQANINVMSRGPVQGNADKQAVLMRWLLGSSIVLQAVDKDYTGYICEDLVPARAISTKTMRMIVPAKQLAAGSVPALDLTDPKNHQEVLARFVHSDMGQRVHDGYAMFNALALTFEEEKKEIERLIAGGKKPKAQTTISHLYYLTHLPMVLSNYGAQPMLKTSAFSKEHTQLFLVLHSFARLFWAPGVVESCPQLRELILEFGIALTIMTLKQNAGSYSRLTMDPACVPDLALATRMSNFCLDTNIPIMNSANGGVWDFICAYNQVHPSSSGRPEPGCWKFGHPYNKSTAFHHWMLHGLLTTLRALADTTASDEAATLFSYKIGDRTSNTISIGDMRAILAVLPASVQEAIDDDCLFELLHRTWPRDVIHERLRVLESMECVAVLRPPLFTRGKHKYWAINTCITLPDVERGMVSMGQMRCPRNPRQRPKSSRCNRNPYVALYVIDRKRPKFVAD